MHVPQTARLIAAQIGEHGAENVSVYGDSAGGTLAMLAVQELAGTDAMPSRMALISPGLTPITDEDFLIDDPVLILLEDAEPVWGDGVNPNAMNGPLTGLPPTAIYFGSLEVLVSRCAAVPTGGVRRR